jgi:hypothetical protein
MVESSLKWPLLSGQPLKSWVHDQGKLLIIGDAAHAMVPYMSQGKPDHIRQRVLTSANFSNQALPWLLRTLLRWQQFLWK